MPCHNCKNRDFSNLKNTWDSKSSLCLGAWTPYGGCCNKNNRVNTRENYGCQRCGLNNNSNFCNSWTRRGNVSKPDIVLTEPFCVKCNNHSNYVNMKKTWSKQPCFTL